jgi:hypothetical protein
VESNSVDSTLRGAANTAASVAKDAAKDVAASTYPRATEFTVEYLAKMTQLVSTGVFFGSALYVSVVEVAARNRMRGVEPLVDHFQATYPLAKAVQGPMALIAAGSGVAAYLNTVDANKNVLLGVALLTFSVWPYTLIAVMPTNEQLLDGDVPKKRGETWVRQMLNRWSWMHSVRTVAGGASLLLLAAYYVK